MTKPIKSFAKDLATVDRVLLKTGKEFKPLTKLQVWELAKSCNICYTIYNNKLTLMLVR